MITEDYVSFEIAKLLKEKGFMNGAIIKFFASGYDYNGNILSIGDTELKDYPRPTLQMAMKWLSEKKNFNINNELSIHGYFCSISHIIRDSIGHIIDVENSESWKTPYYKTYESACEAAIKYCLENLI